MYPNTSHERTRSPPQASAPLALTGNAAVPSAANAVAAAADSTAGGVEHVESARSPTPPIPVTVPATVPVTVPVTDPASPSPVPV